MIATAQIKAKTRHRTLGISFINSYPELYTLIVITTVYSTYTALSKTMIITGFELKAIETLYTKYTAGNSLTASYQFQFTTALKRKKTFEQEIMSISNCSLTRTG